MPSEYQQFLLEQSDKSSVFRSLVSQVPEAGAFVRLLRFSGSARALVLARLRQVVERPVLVLTPDAESAEAWFEDFLQFDGDGVAHFPITETLPYDGEEPTIEIVGRRYGTLFRLLRGLRADCTDESPVVDSVPPVVVAPVETLQRKVPSRAAFEGFVLSFAWGDGVDVDGLSVRMVEMGFERVPMVERRGEFSVRGHIIDVYAPQFEYPVRLDLFGDEIESMRFFDPATQRSFRDGRELERLVVLPVAVEALSAGLAGREDLEGGAGEALLVPLVDWLSEDTLVVLDQPEKFDVAMERFDRIASLRFEEIQEGDSVEFSVSDGRGVSACFPPGRFFQAAQVAQRGLNAFAQLHLPQVAYSEAERGDFDFGVQSYDSIPPNLDAYLSLFKKKQLQDYSIHVVCDNDGQVMRLDELLREHDMDATQLISADSEGSRFTRRDVLEGYQAICVSTGPMHTGFIFPDARLLMVTDREMFGRYKRRHVQKKKYRGKPIGSPTDIQRGDFVVHQDHGVGRYLGIRKQTIDGHVTELVELEYAEGNKLLVPLENVHFIQKYASTEGASPPLDVLGGKRWSRRKKKSQERIEQMAEELLQIYAERESAEGHAFQEDSVWQKEFEDSFLYQETPDQLRTIDEIKGDMTSSRPMDRLLCGDVGFGKTEVAMRAAFKCVQDGKQVAVLVPTTILAQQHYTTFQERFADYPFVVDVISRFRTALEQREVLERLKVGEAHIVIGTHRLLSQDVKFADLGLLIVDEEHRFGVKQKEKIKALRASVDILTLSATPIPRTLHFALSGLRDMSAINTPPRDRLPVRTSVIRFSPREIEAAVMREINRGGQIYFVHNRVQTIHQVAQRLQEIVPQVRVAVGHGQMPERELEKIMLDFIDRKYDILLATTIIESGLDIPNVNTIIINRADAFGLAQLYQLRGRVGRDVKRAYAYLIVPEGKPISDTAIKRLRAIEEFTELGMGFQVAMRDLEIRGTGNILGAEQHGAIDAVGFELYCNLLEEAVQKRRGRQGEETYPVEVKWPAPAFLPSEYIPVESQRIAFYKRLSAAMQESELAELSEELRDRYGQIPEPAERLISAARLRVLARRVDIRSLAATKRGFKAQTRFEPFDLLRIALPLKDGGGDMEDVIPEGDGSITFALKHWSIATGMPRAEEVLRALIEQDADTSLKTPLPI